MENIISQLPAFENNHVCSSEVFYYIQFATIYCMQINA